MPSARVVIISWPDDPERGVEPYGPFSDDDEAGEWVAECIEAASLGWALLRDAEYLISPLTRFDPRDLMQDGATGQPAVKRLMECGYCTDRAILWMEWRTIGRPKGAPVCTAHMCEQDRADNFGVRPEFSQLVTSI